MGWFGRKNEDDEDEYEEEAALNGQNGKKYGGRDEPPPPPPPEDEDGVDHDEPKSGGSCSAPPLFGWQTAGLMGLFFFLASMTTALVWSKRRFNTSESLEWILVGGVTSTSARFRVRLTFSWEEQKSNVTKDFVVYDATEDPELVAPLFQQTLIPESEVLFDPETFNAVENGTLVPQENWIFGIQVNLLAPQQRYCYRVVNTPIDGSTNDDQEPSYEGCFSTPANTGVRFNFTIGAAACAMTGSQHRIFQTIAREHTNTDDDGDDLLFFLHLGDFHYKDISVPDMARRLNAISEVMGSSMQRKLYSQTSLVYMWDDHDYLGNDSGGPDDDPEAREVALRSYQIAFPSHPLALLGEIDEGQDVDLDQVAPLPPYQAFTIGTVRFIVNDLRSEADGTNIYSAEQQQWLFNELQTSSEQFDYVIWVTTKPWIGTPTSPGGDDSWRAYSTDRQALSDVLSGLTKQNVLAVSADAHMLAFDDGRNTYYGNNVVDEGSITASFPILQTGPLDRLGSTKGGPFSHGCRTIDREIANQYSTIAYQTLGDGNYCLVITTYTVNDLGGRSEVFKEEYCGSGIYNTMEAAGSGSCDVRALRGSTVAYFSVGLVSLVVAMVASCMLAGSSPANVDEDDEKAPPNPILTAFLVSFFLLVWWFFTILVGVGIPVAKGFAQYPLNQVGIIAMVFGLCMLIFVGCWYMSVREPSSEEEEGEEDYVVEVGEDGQMEAEEAEREQERLRNSQKKNSRRGRYEAAEEYEDE